MYMYMYVYDVKTNRGRQGLRCVCVCGEGSPFDIATIYLKATMYYLQLTKQNLGPIQFQIGFDLCKPFTPHKNNLKLNLVNAHSMALSLSVVHTANYKPQTTKAKNSVGLMYKINAPPIGGGLKTNAH